jgi:Ca2+-dependent lipid-binding protein
MNGVQLKTTVQRKNRNPIWNEEFSLVVKHNSAAVTVAIYDKVRDLSS